MPHPKNHLKLTGDTHLPDVGDDDMTDLDMEPGADFEDAAPAAIRQASAVQPATPLGQHHRPTRNLTKTLAILAVGLVLLRVFR